MVQLEEVEDAELDRAQPGPVGDDYDSDDFVDTDSELSDDDVVSSGPPAESIADRLLALRDILPPRYRRALSSTISSTLSVTKTGAWWGGQGLWVLTTGAIMLSVPFAVCVVEEQQIVEQEREVKAQEGAREVLVPGVSGGGGEGGGGGGSGL
ncbi:MAG: mitochondrial import receptor protein [Alectoria fallacina]|uniref:Mitochondrial import receptor protein n=1 Tax=Alectoria fallacina TaxID=1903189 RepID=A0A8H3IN37_9LECA|nr:MAG: mitochondrial import receptor protein [Alectoria fallacina]